MGYAIGQIMIFMVYAFAMLALVVLAFFVWRKTNLGSLNGNKGNIKIEESLCISPKKTLFIINVDNERILIASDSENTTFLTKLNSKDEKGNILDIQNKIETEKTRKEINILQELIKKRGT